MTSLWKRFNSFRYRRTKSSTWPSRNGESSADTIFVNSYTLCSGTRKCDRLEKPDLCLNAPNWFQLSLSRESAMEYLSKKRIGCFVIRNSSSNKGCYALSVRVPKYNNRSGICHYLVFRTSRGYFKMKGLEKEWSSLDSMVTHHSVMREMLPCTLHLSSDSASEEDEDNEDGEEEGKLEEEDEQSDDDNNHTDFAMPRKIFMTMHSN